jgi:hypothetical protein
VPLETGPDQVSRTEYRPIPALTVIGGLGGVPDTVGTTGAVTGRATVVLPLWTVVVGLLTLAGEVVVVVDRGDVVVVLEPPDLVAGLGLDSGGFGRLTGGRLVGLTTSEFGGPLPPEEVADGNEPSTA